MMQTTLLFIGNLLLFGLLLHVSNAPQMSNMRRSGLNPIFLFATLQLMSGILFLSTEYNGWITHSRYAVSITLIQFEHGYVTFTLYNAALTIGLAAGTYIPQRNGLQQPIYTSEKQKLFTSLLFWSVALAGLFIVFFVFNIRTVDSLKSVTSDRFNAFSSSSYFIYLVTLIRLFLLPYLILIGHKSIFFWLAIVACILITMTSGSRLNILTTLLAILFYLNQKGITIRKTIFLISLPALGLISMALRYFTRAFETYDSYGALVQESGGLINTLLNPLELHYHLTLPALEALNAREEVTRYFGESFVGLITLPVPRSIFPLKSGSVSAEFSEYIDPVLWEAVRSQVTLGLFGETFIEYGLVLGMFVICLIGLGFSYLTIYSCQRQSPQKELGTYVLVLIAFALTRGGIVNIGLLLWPLIAVILAYKFSTLPIKISASRSYR